MRIPNRGHIQNDDGFSHAVQRRVGVARVLLRSEFEYMSAVRILVDAKMLAKGRRSGARDAQLVRQGEGRPMEFLLQIHLSDSCGVQRSVVLALAE